MSDQPLGRDRLGRLVYAGDAIEVRNDHGIALKNEYGTYYACVWDGVTTYIFSPTSIMTVDLSASPKRTFYERYFADLGTINQIIVAYMDDALQSDDLFWFDFEHDLWWDFDHANLETWLQQEATV